MTKIKLYISLVLVLGLIPSLFGQEIETQEVESPKIVLRARANQDAILLRWGVSNKVAWDYGNQFGYIIERATILRDEQPLPQSDIKVLTGGAIKPKPLEDWKPLIENNDMAAVTAQAIYGEDFSVNNGEENPFIQVINQSSELQQRFGFAMFAIDQDFETAQYAGLGFIDNSVKRNERYIYSVKLAAPEEMIKIQEDDLVISPSVLNDLPKPYDFAGYYYNNAFVLIWEYEDLVNFYNSYDLEKSEDGINFIKINKVPITKLSDSQVSGISFTDTIPEYGKKYWYRVLGRSIFNEKSPPSDSISLVAYKELLVAPELKKNEVISDKEVILNWGFAEDEAWKLTHFDVLRAAKPNGPYASIKEKLGASERSYRYNELKEINYFKIRAHGIGGDYQDSSPNMIQPIDSIPPLQPIGFKGKIDTLGVVQLTWQANVELDLKGYSVLRANRPNQEFTRLNKEEITTTTFTDTINLKTFNKKVFYKLVALDNRYNESVPSTILEIERPDTNPPVSPVFESYEVLGDTIQIKWITSSSENVSKQILYRKQILERNEGLWENIFETVDHTVSQFNDTKIIDDTKYLYTIVAVNANEVESEPSPPLSIITRGTLIKPGIKGFSSTVDRDSKFIQLSWRHKEPNVSEIQLFRKDSESDFSLYQTFSSSRKQFIDTNLKPNTTYNYAIKAIFNDGSISEWVAIKVIY